MAQVVSLYRYPIKGFEGELLSDVSLVCGKGVPGDRAIGITRSNVTKGAAPFHQLTTNPNLVHFLPGKHGGVPTLFDRRSGGSENVLSNPVLLSDVFGVQATVIHGQDGNGHWDFDDSMLSIINVATVQALSALMGVPVDPLRFRGNIYIEAEPFSEFGWLGRGVDLGQASLSIIRPIKRCKATSVNPESGELDMNIPAQLNRHFGHMYCGVYAQVERAGKVMLGDKVVTTQQRYPEKLAVATTVPRAPALVSWPRPAKVVEVIEEASGIRSIWLHDPLAALGSLNQFVAGQHVALHSLTIEGTWRRYTISGIEGDRLRITVKRQGGEGSQAVHALTAGQILQISGPFGPDALDMDSPSNLFLTAGIGITPTVTKLKALAENKCLNPVHVVHSVRHREELALWGEVISIVEQLSNGSTALHITQGDGHIGEVTGERPNIAALIDEAAEKGAAIHVCGPDQFQAHVLANAMQAGVAHRLHMDSFATPDSPVELRDIPDSGPFTVIFKRAGIAAQWHPEDGTLLSFAEAKGLVVPAHCRAGLCQTCECALVDGEILPLIETSRARTGYALLCAAIPGSDIILDC